MVHRSRALLLAAFVAAATFALPGGSQPVAPAASSPSAAPPEPTRFDPGSLREPLEKLVADVRGWGGRVGVLAIDVSSGAPVAAVDEHGVYNPASNAKLFTAAAALRLLGPSFRYATGLYGAVADGTIAELVLRGAGDPSLEARDLWEMARELRDAGVRKIGGVAVDQGYFDERYVPPAFEQQPDEWAAFRAPVAAASLNANTVLFTVRAGKPGEAASVAVEPTGFVDLTGSVTTAKKGTPEKIGLHLEPRGGRLVARLSGHVPEDIHALSIAKRVDDPRLLVGYALKEILEQTGIRVGDEVRLGGEHEEHLLVVHRSAPLGQLLAALGKSSDNFYAETVFKTIAAEQRGRPGTAAAAAELVTQALGELGAVEQGLIIKNGSGLFDADRTSPWSMAALLRAALRDPSLGPDFVAQLSIGGVDGTLRGRFRGWAKERAIRAKTGTLASVAALSGYVLPPPGRSAIAFAILANDIPGKVDLARRAMDALVAAMARELWKGAR